MNIRSVFAAVVLFLALPAAVVSSARGAAPGGGPVPATTAEWIEALRPALRGDDAAGGKDLLAVGRPTARLPASLLLPFAPKSAALTADGKTRLDRLGAALKSDALMASAFRLEFFPSPELRNAVDDALSDRRADAIVQHLVTNSGVARDRLEMARGRGAPPGGPDTGRDSLLVIITNLGE